MKILTRIALIATLATTAPGVSRAAGEVEWFTLLTENLNASLSFYEGMFGWVTVASPTGAYLMTRNGVPFAGVNAIENRLPEAQESLWLAAIQVDDVLESTRTARRLGGVVHEDVSYLEGWGVFAIIEDPQGAPAVIVNPERALGGREGFSGWAWAELWTHDTSAAADFYQQVVGFGLETVDVGGQPYTVFGSQETPLAGLAQLPNPDTAPRWAPYVGVTDLRATLVRVWQQGGTVLLEPSEVPSEIGGHNRTALITDPAGAALFLYQISEEATSDPIVQSQQFGSRPVNRTPIGASSPVNVSVSVSVGYGFGPGWNSRWARYPGHPMGPYFP